MNLQRAFAYGGMLVVSLYLLWVVVIWIASDWGKPAGAAIHHFDIDVSEGSKLEVRKGEIKRIEEESMPRLGYIQTRAGHVSIVDQVFGIALAIIALIACSLLARKPDAPPSL